MIKPLDKTSDEFGTPQWMFDELHDEFNFTIDCCASIENHKLPRFYTKEDNALIQNYSNERVFCNPPFSRGNVKDFFFLALRWTRQEEHPAKLWVLLIPTYTERDWYHDYRNQFECRKIKGRIQFEGGSSGARGNHMLCIFRNKDWIWYSV